MIVAHRDQNRRLSCADERSAIAQQLSRHRDQRPGGVPNVGFGLDQHELVPLEEFPSHLVWFKLAHRLPTETLIKPAGTVIVR